MAAQATFDLGAGHSVVWDESGAKITYQGNVTRFNFTPAGRTGMLLPARHTRLVTGAARETRDFFEIGAWLPSSRSSGIVWTLSWHLFEVHGDQVRIAGSITDLVSETDRPSADRPLDLRTLIALRVNDAGAAEWSSMVPNKAGREIIESPGDRQRQAEEAAAHEAARARVDWSRTLDVARSPSFQYLPAEGCTLLSLTAFALDRAEAIRIIVDRQGLGLTTAPRVIDLSRQRRVAVTVHVYERALRDSPFCTERRQSTTEQIWRAVSGTIRIETTATGIARNQALYRATIRVERAQFVNDAGLRVSQPAPVVLSALVGAAWRYHH